jgi:NADH-quinone oxidoreductase subunit L
MHDLLWLIPALPLVGSVILMLGSGQLSTRHAAIIGAGSVGLAAVIAFMIAAVFLLDPPASGAYQQSLWHWFNVDGFSPEIGLRLDPLSLVMMLVITGVGFFIHLFSTEFMEGEEGYARF